MPRVARKKSSTGYYHIMMRGVDRQKIFKEDCDYRFFEFLLKKYSSELNIALLAYCLMTNHFHILMKTDQPALFIKKISSAYVKYFNQRYERIGHLFQERFKSEPVEDDVYLLTVTRYILQNPQKAGIAKYNEYCWNNWSEFLHPTFCNTEIITDILRSRECLIEYMEQTGKDRCIGINESKYMDRDEVEAFIVNQYELNSIDELHDFSREKQARILKELKAEGFSSVQIIDATGISRGIIQKI